MYFVVVRGDAEANVRELSWKLGIEHKRSFTRVSNPGEEGEEGEESSKDRVVEGPMNNEGGRGRLTLNCKFPATQTLSSSLKYHSELSLLTLSSSLLFYDGGLHIPFTVSLCLVQMLNWQYV